jgi:hypothetical protein
VKHISKPITFLLYELAGSIKSHFVEHLLLCFFFTETNFQSRILLKKNLIFQSSQDFWPTLYRWSVYIATSLTGVIRLWKCLNYCLSVVKPDGLNWFLNRDNFWSNFIQNHYLIEMPCFWLKYRKWMLFTIC